MRVSVCLLFVFHFAIKVYLFILLKIVEDEKQKKEKHSEDKWTRKKKETIKYHKFIELLRCLSTPISALPEFTRTACHTGTPTILFAALRPTAAAAAFICPVAMRRKKEEEKKHGF